jgi:hypothetical protein
MAVRDRGRRAPSALLWLLGKNAPQLRATRIGVLLAIYAICIFGWASVHEAHPPNNMRSVGAAPDFQIRAVANHVRVFEKVAVSQETIDPEQFRAFENSINFFICESLDISIQNTNETERCACHAIHITCSRNCAHVGSPYIYRIVASAPTQTEGTGSLVSFARMSRAGLVQTKGLGSQLCSLR